MQNKKQINEWSVAPLFHKAALKFTLRWMRKHNCKLRVRESDIQSIERMAACNPRWPQHLANQDFTDSYWQFPDLAAALLNFLRQKWSKLETSRSGKLKKILSHEAELTWDDEFNSCAAVKEAEEYETRCQERRPPDGAPVEAFNKWIKTNWIEWANRKFSGPIPNTLGQVRILDLQDQEIQKAIAKLSGMKEVTVDEVAKNRRWVAREHQAAKKFSEQVLDKSRFLQLKTKPIRRNLNG